jgi:hypothetical protein
VLETLEQHLTYKVEPAASRADLRAQYLSRVAQQDKEEQRQTKQHLDEVARLWSERTGWWSRRYDVPAGFRFHEESRHKSARMAEDSAERAAPAPSMSIASGAGMARAEAAPPPPPSAESKADKKEEGGRSASIAIQP